MILSNQTTIEIEGYTPEENRNGASVGISITTLRNGSYRDIISLTDAQAIAQALNQAIGRAVGNRGSA